MNSKARSMIRTTTDILAGTAAMTVLTSINPCAGIAARGVFWLGSLVISNHIGKVSSESAVETAEEISASIKELKS